MSIVPSGTRNYYELLNLCTNVLSYIQSIADAILKVVALLWPLPQILTLQILTLKRSEKPLMGLKVSDRGV